MGRAHQTTRIGSFGLALEIPSLAIVEEQLAITGHRGEKVPVGRIRHVPNEPSMVRDHLVVLEWNGGV